MNSFCFVDTLVHPQWYAEKKRESKRIAFYGFLACTILAGLFTFQVFVAPRVARAASGPACQLSVSNETTLVATPPSGFSGSWADNNLAIVPVGNSTFDFISSDFHTFAQPPNGTYVGVTQGTLDNPTANGVIADQGIQNFKASPRRYAGVTSNVYVDTADSMWIGLYHDEEDNTGSFYSREGLAKSTDNGHTWYDLGEVLTPHLAYDSSNTHQIDLYISAFTIVSVSGVNYMYLYFKEPNADGSLATQLSVARAPLADVITNAKNGSVPAFSKYYNGAWSQPALGGNASELRTDGQGSTYFTGSATVIYNAAIQRYLMFGYTNGGSAEDMLESSDGLSWGNPQFIFTNESGQAYYATPVGLDGSPTVAGNVFYLYIAVLSRPGTNSDILVRRTLTCNSATHTTIDDATTGSGTDQFNYHGSGWGSCSNYCSSHSQYAGTEHWDQTTNDSLTIAFTGSGIDFYAERGAGAGIAGFSIDGGNEKLIDTYSPIEGGDQLVWSSGVLANGAHTLTVRITGQHNTSATSAYVLPDRADISTSSPSVTTVDDAITGSGTNQFNYHGSNWGSCNNDCSSNTQYAGTEHWDQTANDSLTIPFNGTGIAFYAEVGPGAGIAGFTIDGGGMLSVDTSSAVEVGNQLIWSSGPLTSGAHTLTVIVTGQHSSQATSAYILPDRVDIYS